MLIGQILAICRFGPPTSKRLPSSSLGHPNPRYSYPPGLSCCRFILECGYDSKQQEEGSQGKGSRQEEGVDLDGETVLEEIAGVSQHRLWVLWGTSVMEYYLL